MGLFDRITSFETLEKLNDHWKDCQRCMLRLKHGQVCPGLGHEKCVVMVVGRSPTKPEALNGKGMMTDHGGQEIRRFFSNIAKYWGMKPEDIYFTNIVKCPASVRDPNKEQYVIDADGYRTGNPVIPVDECGSYLEEEIAIIQPKLIISIGEPALRYFAGQDKKIPSSLDKARKRIWKYRNSNFIACAMPIVTKDNKEAQINVAEDKQYLRNNAFPRVSTPTQSTDTLDIVSVFNAVEHCEACGLCRNANVRTFGFGHTKSDVMFVGEAPGAKENEVGAPFVGAAGQFLWANVLRKVRLPANSAVADAHGRLDLKRIYMTNAVKCWPGSGNPTPTQEQIETCNVHLQNQIKIVDPRVIVCLGGTAAKAVTGMDNKVGQMRNNIWDCPFSKAQIVVTWHPSYAMRQGDQATGPCLDMINDITKALELAHAN